MEDDKNLNMTGAEILQNIFDKTPELKKTDAEQATDTSTEASMEAREEEKTDEISPQETEATFKNLKTLITDGKTTEFLAALPGTKKAVLDKIGEDESLMKAISSFDKDSRITAYDYLHTSVINLDTLLNMVYERFGVVLVSDTKMLDKLTDDEKKEYEAADPEARKEWTRNGIISVYSTFLKLPQSHLDLINAVYTYDTSHVKGPEGLTHTNIDSEGKKGTYGVYGIAYDRYHTDELEGDGEYGTTDFNTKGKANQDGGIGLNRMGNVIAHELGHVVDFSASTPYSETVDFQKNSQWEKLPDNPRTLVGIMEYECFEPGKAMPEVFQGDDRDIAEEIAAKIIGEKRSTSDKADEAIEEVILDYEESGRLSNRPNQMTQNEREFYRRERENREYNEHFPKDQIPTDYSMLYNGRLSIPTLKSLLKSSTELITHARRSLDKAWYKGECFDNMKRQIHMDYHNVWYSYDTKIAQEKKISRYQYTNPCEEFAESFACYYMSKDDAERQVRMPKDLKSWFDANNFDLKRAIDKYRS